MTGVTRRDLLRTAAVAGAVDAVADVAEAREGRRAAPDEVGMLYDSTLCVGCRACQTACKVANGLPPDARDASGGEYDAPLDLNATTKNIIKLATDGPASTYMKMQCMHCVDPACVSVCMMKALHVIEDGTVAYDVSRCVGCRYCQIACPFNVPKFEWSKSLPVVQDPKIVKCELCRHRKEGPACCEVCPRGAVIYGKRTALLAEARHRIAAQPGKYFEDRVYGEVEGGGTHVLYLSPAGVSFQALGLPALPSRPAPELSETIQHGIYQGAIAPIALLAAFTITARRARRASNEEDRT